MTSIKKLSGELVGKNYKPGLKFAFSVAVPLGGFILLAVWLRERFGLGTWVIWVGTALGFLFAIDGLRLAAVNTPSMLTTPLSVIAGIVLGEYSVKSGWFNSETMLYMAFVTVANYSQSSYELGYAIKFMRVILLVFTSLLNIWGFALGTLLVICAVVFNKTIAGKSYIYPLIPFSWSECRKRFFRCRLPHRSKNS